MSDLKTFLYQSTLTLGWSAEMCHQLGWRIEVLKSYSEYCSEFGGFITEKPDCPLRDTYTQPGEQRLSGRADTAAQSDSQQLYNPSNAPPLPFTAHQHQTLLRGTAGCVRVSTRGSVCQWSFALVVLCHTNLRLYILCALPTLLD